MTHIWYTAVRTLLTATALCLSMLAQARPAAAHPHVFVETQIDVVMDDQGLLNALRVTWRFDQFHSLYILSFDGITPTEDGGLTPEAQANLASSYTDWQRGFDGFAKLSLEADPIALAPPSDVSAALQGGQIEISFTRLLSKPTTLDKSEVEIAVYDETYYHDVSLIAPPNIIGGTLDCDATLEAFDPDSMDEPAQAALYKLQNEEPSPTDDIGRYFADRITISCT